jgi:hypothetical protein
MANFTPRGTIHIGRVPFDNSYRHTVISKGWNQAAQAAAFMTKMDSSLEENTYTYVRMNNAIRVNFNAERLYTYNYVMYQNANYGSKWFYAFIVGCNYINENCTELLLELDVIQTWWYDWSLKKALVEREHVADDTIGLHCNPEPQMGFNLETKDRFTNIDMWDKWVIVQTNAYPEVFIHEPLTTGYAKPVSGGEYQRCYCGSKYYAFDDMNVLQDFLNHLNEFGSADSISNIFMFPKDFTPNVGSDHGVATDSIPTGQDWSTTRPTSLGGGYVPKNNKLFTYPYCFCRMTDNNGGQTELKYELWANIEGFHYLVTSALDPDASLIVAPKGYAGVQTNYDAGLSFPITQKCGWTYSAYQTWSAQNGLANALSIIANTAMVAVPAARGLGVASRFLSQGAKSATSAATKGSGVLATKQASRQTEKIQASSADIASGAGIAGLLSLAATGNRMEMTPDTLRGSTAGNTMYQLHMQTFNVDQVVITREFAEIVDDFFSMFGYCVEVVKTPNIYSRPSWNYVKTINSANNGNVPADDMAQINSIFDSGITFWHTWDVGNYSLNNQL